MAEAEGGSMADGGFWPSGPILPLDSSAAEVYPPDTTVTLARIEAKLDHLVETLEHFRPVIDAYLSPAASGPVAWAVRRQQRKG
jgi:hypothetical protein